MKPHLQIIITSTRPGRSGPRLASWLQSYAESHNAFRVEVVDLADIALPLFDEPMHPRAHQYQHEHTKRWSEIAARADAYIFVLPEYDHLPPSSFVNAVTFLNSEWNYKAVSFLSYGGVSGGIRAAETARLMVNAVKMVPILETIPVPGYSQYIDDAGNFKPSTLIEASAKTVLDELFKMNSGLIHIRKIS
ncbi:NADPH-dependent FMN reductase [Bartonella sp. LJL80]